MKRIGVFYLSLVFNPDALPPQHILRLGANTEAYLRVVEVRGDNLEDALDAAQPQKNEMVMNTHFLE